MPRGRRGRGGRRGAGERWRPALQLLQLFLFSSPFMLSLRLPLCNYTSCLLWVFSRVSASPLTCFISFSSPGGLSMGAALELDCSWTRGVCVWPVHLYQWCFGANSVHTFIHSLGDICETMNCSVDGFEV